MQYKNSKRTVLMPLIIGASLIVGIIIGYKVLPSGRNSAILNKKSDKLTAILHLVEENYVDDLPSDSLQQVVIEEFLANLDPHSHYIPAQDMEAVNAPLVGNFDGIGIQFNIQNDTLLIINTISGGPSEKKGVKAGDRIIKVNDTLIAGIGLKNEDVIRKLKGIRGSKIKIKIKRADEPNLLTFEITRDKIPLFSIPVAYMISPKIGYIKISRFASTTHNEFIEKSKQLLDKGMENLILDLRQNGGGYLSAAVDIADEFLPKGKMIVYTKGSHRNKLEYVATKKGNCENIKLTILIDAWTASASEIVTGAMQDNDRAIVIGQRSFGKGLVQEPIMFKDGSGIRLTIARYYTPTGRCIQKPYNKGIKSYEEDIYNRAAHGEFEAEDSIHFKNILKYTTPKGNIVYGGGGIMPNIFVPTDTTGYSFYYQKIKHQGLIYRFALKYADTHRKDLSKFSDSEEIKNYLLQHNIYKNFKIFAENKKVLLSSTLNNKQKELIVNEIEAYIARDIIGDNGFYPIINQQDVTIQKAIEQFQKFDTTK